MFPIPGAACHSHDSGTLDDLVVPGVMPGKERQAVTAARGARAAALVLWSSNPVLLGPVSAMLLLMFPPLIGQVAPAPVPGASLAAAIGLGLILTYLVFLVVLAVRSQRANDERRRHPRRGEASVG